MNSLFLPVGSYFLGTYILNFFGISLPVVQVGGGLIVISTGWAPLASEVKPLTAGVFYGAPTPGVRPTVRCSSAQAKR